MPRLLKKYVALFVILIFNVSCGRLPDKPSIDLCVYDFQTDMAFCANNQTGNEFDLTRGQIDNYVAISPDDWGKTLAYIRLLEGRVNRSVKRELQKVRFTSTKLITRTMDGNSYNAKAK